MVDQFVESMMINYHIKLFAPQVYLYSQDRFRPSSVPWILQYAALQYPPFTNILKTSMTEVLAQGQVTPTSLVAQVARNPETSKQESSGYSYDIKRPVFSAAVTDFALYYADASRFNFEPPEGSVLCGQPLQPDPNNPGKMLCSAPCYAHYRPLQGKFAGAAITYNFFYPFNGPSGIHGYLPIEGVHVGDWEHITVYLSPDQSRVVLVFFAAHGGGIFAFPGQFKTQKDENGMNTHVVVYSGSGGHPSYPTPGLHDNKFQSPDYTDDGVSWPTWQTVMNVGDIYNSTGPAGGSEWLKYSGRWGLTSNFGDSPPTPSFQSWWNGEPGEQTIVGNSGAYQSFLLQTDTPIAANDGANNFAYWGVADYNGDGIPDLFGVKVRNTGSGKVEVHVLNGATNFQKFLLQTPTNISVDDAANFRWSIANTGSPKPPLYGIKINNTGTETVEVHVLNGETNYTSFMFEHGTVLGAADGAQNFAAWDISYTTGSTWLSLFCTKVRNTGTEMVEMHILDGGNSFESFLYEHGTSITQADGAANYSAWLVADYLHNGWYDLFGIKVNNTVTGQVEVVILDGGNKLESVLLQVDTPITADDGANNFGGWALGDFNRDNTPDLFAIKVRNTGTGNVEVHVLNGATSNSGN